MSVLDDMLPDAEAAPRIASLGARSIWVVYHDFTGLPRAKVVPSSRAADVFTSGVSFNKANWDVDITGSVIPESAYGADSGDFRAVPDPRTLVALPHRAGVAQVYTYLHDDHGIWDGDPRGRLLAQTVRLTALGIAVQVGLEAEFSIVNETGQPVSGQTGSRMFALSEVDAMWSYWERVVATLEALNVPVHQVGREFGDGQFEVSLLPADPVTACDQMLLTRQVIKSLATDRGWIASFMPKPWADQPGNGLHVHLSFWDLSGRDLLTDLGDAERLSLEARHVLGGLLHHARAQIALACPTANSFRRLRPGTWAPAHVTWGIGNRAVLVRVPGADGAIRFEYRAGDAGANLYLHVLGLLAASVDGLSKRLLAPPMTTGAALAWTDEDAAANGVARLPATLEEALVELAVDGVLLTALGESIGDHYLAVKRHESARAAKEGDPDPAQVSLWETMTYFAAL